MREKAEATVHLQYTQASRWTETGSRLTDDISLLSLALKAAVGPRPAGVTRNKQVDLWGQIVIGLCLVGF